MPYLRSLILSAAVAGTAAGQVPTFRGSLPAGRLTADGVHLPPGVVRVFGDLKFRDSQVIDRVYSPDGKWLLTLGYDGLTIRDADTGAVAGRVNEAFGYNSCLRVAPDGKTAWVCATIHTAAGNVWTRELRTVAIPGGAVVARRPVGTFPRGEFPAGDDRVLAGGRVLSRHADGGFVLSDPATGAEIARRPAGNWRSPDKVHAASADGTRVMVRDAYGHVFVLDAATLAVVPGPPPHKSSDAAFGPPGVVFTHDLDTTPLGDRAGTAVVRRWVGAAATPAASFSVRLPRGSTSPGTLAVSPDGGTVVVNMFETAVRVHDGATGAERFTLDYGGWNKPRITFRPDGKEIAVGEFGSAFYDAATGRRHPRSADLSDGGLGWTAALRFSRDGATLTAVPEAHGDVIDYATATGAMTGRRTWREAAERGEFAGLRGDRPRGDLLPAARSADGTHAARVVREVGTVAAPNPTGFTMVVSDGGRDIRLIPGVGHCFHEFAFCPGGKYLVGHSPHTAVVYDVAAADEFPLRIDPDRLNRSGSVQADPAVYPNPDGRTVAVHDVNANAPGTPIGYRFGVGVFALATREEVGRVRGVGNLTRVAWSPDGTRLAATGRFNWDDGGGRVYLWDAATGKELAAFPPQKYGPHQLAFSPDGGTLAVAGPDHVVTLFEAATGKPRRTLPGVGGAIAFSPDGRHFAAAGHKNLVFLWDVSSPPDPGMPRDAAWETLASDDAPAAFAAVLHLAADPSAVAFLVAKPADEVAPGDIPSLIEKLDSPNFAAREAASDALRAAGGRQTPCCGRRPPSRRRRKSATARRSCSSARCRP